jgi:FlaG/FlaF family flagellin (archaellin)
LPRKRSRKGISDIVANLLIMAMVVALFGMVILWASGYLGQSQGIWNVQSRRAQEAIVIETAKYDGSTLTLYVRNVGTSTVELNVLYVRDATVNYELPRSSFKFYRPADNATLTPGEATVVAKQLVRIEANISLPKGTYRLTLVTTLGADAAFIYVAP